MVELFSAGHQVIAIDNLINSKLEALKRVEQISGHKIQFYHADIADKAVLQKIFSSHSIDGVIHFAALKSVSESISNPLRYYQNNVSGTLSLLESMQTAGVHCIVFSSSATVYKDAGGVALLEDCPLGPGNPYGQSKLMVENILRDVARSEVGWRVALLRYFNPVGAHESGMIGEDPNGVPNNLMPYISQVAVGNLAELKVYGDDYPTIDGTGVRDYIHVVDLAIAHVKALDIFTGEPEVVTLNLGTGQGYSVLQTIHAFSKACGRNIPYRIVERRSGDIACCYANPAAAEQRLGWKAERNLEEMCRDSWRWQQDNPSGYLD